jgi:hypothetical protein
MNHLIQGLVCDYLDEEDTINFIESNVFDKDLCLERLMYLYNNVNDLFYRSNQQRKDRHQINIKDIPRDQHRTMFYDMAICTICKTYHYECFNGDEFEYICKNDHHVCSNCFEEEEFEMLEWCSKCDLNKGDLEEGSEGIYYRQTEIIHEYLICYCKICIMMNCEKCKLKLDRLNIDYEFDN